MGKGILRRIKMAKIAKEVEEMRKQTEELVNDPEGAFQKMAKPLIAQLQSATYEKNKLSALVCALLEAQGGQVVVKRKAIDQFQQHRLTILTEAPETDDGVNPEADLTFTYKAEFVNQPPITQPPLVNNLGQPINDLGNTAAAQADMGAVSAQADAAREAGVEEQ